MRRCCITQGAQPGYLWWPRWVGRGKGSAAQEGGDIYQFSSVPQLCPTLCDPMDCSTPCLPVHYQFPEFTQTHVHWVGDAISIHISIPPEPSTPPLLSYHRALGWAPWIIQQLPTSYLFYIWKNICFNATVSIHPILFFPCCVHRFILYVWFLRKAQEDQTVKCIKSRLCFNLFSIKLGE